MNKKTIYFKNCLGVFQGGGCKALSFVGAYKECNARGVFFSQVAGTSAGSIIAALISAGATPEYLESIIKETEFNSFKKEVDEKLSSSEYKFTRLFLSCLWNKKSKYITKFIKYFGLYSSSEIDNWLETHLKKLLNINSSEKVKFSDLNIPLTIVATELGSTKPKIWSNENSPEASVSYAVRCSCTIPFFFQPVDGQYVDGGIISNLPSFVMNNGVKHNFEKLLCFTFSPEVNKQSKSMVTNNNQPILTNDSYLKKLISSIIDGSVHIQNELQPNLHIIQIENLPLSTVDFDKINEDSLLEMFKAGENAAIKFFESEVVNIRSIKNSRLVLNTEPETLNQIVREDINSKDHIIFSLNTTRYIYNLFPTVLKWSLAGIKITFITKPIHLIANNTREENHEKFRRLVLKSLGTSLIESETLPFEGALFGNDDNLGNAIIFHELRNHDYPVCFAVKYEKSTDNAVISSLRTQIKPLTTNQLQPPVTSIKFSKNGIDILFERLKNVHQYSSPEVKINIEEIDVSQIIFLTKYVKSYKYNQIKSLFEIYKNNDIDLFENIQIKYELNGKEIIMPMTPPVAELHGNKFYLFEGNSRLTYLIREQNVKKVKLVVIRNVSAPLPSKGKFFANQLLISDEDKKGDERYEGFDRTIYRNIEESVRSPSIYKDIKIDG